MDNTWKYLEKYACRFLEPIYGFQEAGALARHLVLAHSQLSYLKILTGTDLSVGEDKKQSFLDDLARIQNHEPIQYVLGKADFCDMELRVNSGVLIPRPETEQMVGLILNQKEYAPARIADFCTGSGCIALALKYNYSHSPKVFGIDVCDKALEVALQNGQNQNLEVEWIKTNVLDPNQTQHLPSNLDLVVSNPPYIPISQKKSMPQNVADYEPSLALFVDDDMPILFYQTIGQIASKLLVSGGQLWFEVHENYARCVSDCLATLDFEQIEILDDFHRKPRFVCAIKI